MLQEIGNCSTRSHMQQEASNLVTLQHTPGNDVTSNTLPSVCSDLDSKVEEGGG